MKKTLSLSALIITLVFCQACKKNGGGGGNPGGGNPGGGHTTKKWLIKSVIGKYDATKWGHTVIKYNDTGRILQIGYGLSGLKDTFDQSMQSFVDYTYDSVTGRLTFMKPDQAPGLKFVYLSPYSIQIIPFPFYPKSDGVETLNFNGHGRNELDSRVSYIPPGNIGEGTSTRGYIYNDIGGIQGETTLDDKGNSQDVWTFLSPGPSKSIPNPFVGTSIEQRLVYFTSRFGLLNSYDMLGGTWSNGVMEAYSYTSGTKKPLSDFGNNYKVDANGLVIEVMPTYKLSSPSTSPWLNIEPYYVTYEQH